jgi:hypothetical protein
MLPAQRGTHSAVFTSSIVVVVVSLGVIHNVVLSQLKPATRYYYVCGGGSAWSAQFSFVTLPSADSPG